MSIVTVPCSTDSLPQSERDLPNLDWMGSIEFRMVCSLLLAQNEAIKFIIFTHYNSFGIDLYDRVSSNSQLAVS